MHHYCTSVHFLSTGRRLPYLSSLTALALPRIPPSGHNGGMTLNILHIDARREDDRAAIAELRPTAEPGRITAR